jgi:hypothetical protein
MEEGLRELMKGVRSLLNRATCELPNLQEGSPELQSADINPRKISAVPAQPEFRPR